MGAFGFVDAMNWGLVKFRHDVNSTVEPRYCEHLMHMCKKSLISTLSCNVPVAQCCSRHEWHIPDDVHRLRVQADHDTLYGQGDTTRILYHSHTITEREVLVL